jgi:hypothetical protein
MDVQDPDLEKLYRDADYVIDDAGVNLTIRLDRSNPELQVLLREQNARTWAFLTAYNPNSLPASPDQNAARQAELISTVEKHGHRYFQGYGTGEDWEPEASIFILDITRETAIALGQKFAQTAILWGKIDQEPELLWCI